MNWVNGRHAWMQTLVSYCSVPLFVLAVLLSLGFSSLVLASDEAAQCSTQMAKTMADPILKSRIFGSLVQQNLAIIYQDNPDYQADAKGPKNMLADGRIGRITEKWLGYFCQEFNQAASVENENDFVSQLLTALVTVAELTQNYPNWRQSLVSEEFKSWLAVLTTKGQYSEPSCEAMPYCYGTPTQLHGLFDEFYLNPRAEHYTKEYPEANPGASSNVRSNGPDYYQPVVRPQPQVLSYYQFNDIDMGKLTLWSENTTKFNKLVGKKFSSDIEIGTALTPIVVALIGTDDSETVSKRLAALITVTPAEYQLLSPKPSEPSPEEPKPDEQSPEAKAASQTSPKASTSDNGDANSTETSGAAAAAVITPAPATTTQVLSQPQTYEVSRETADNFLRSLSLLALSEAQLAKLSSLTGSVFLDDYLLSIAIKELALELDESQAQALNTLAHKTGKQGQAAGKPLVWQPTPGCGCTQNSIIEDGNERPYYGFYPYWQQETGTSIDYSHLTRMGYFSAVIQGPQLLLPNNWRAEKAYSQFAINAHNHRVKVDLVFSSRGEEVASPSRGWPYNQNMVEQIIAAVKTPITGNMINRIKPVISLGTSPSRTLGDGVTLNLDLKEINSQEKVDEFIDFIKKLKRGLSSKASSGASSNTSLDRVSSLSGVNSSASDEAKPTDEYYLNLMVPAYELEAETPEFYTVDNLAKIEPYINIFIVNFSPLSSAAPTPANNSVSSLKAFRTLLGDAAYSDSAGRVFAKVIPFIGVNDADINALEAVVNYTQWSYLGAAFWTMPLSAQAATLIEKSYFPVKPLMFPSLQPVVELADKVCNQVCPLRWPLRLVFLLLVLIVVIYAIASWWIFSLRQLFSRWYFLVFLLLASLFIMLVFGCDPYWQQQQQLFLFIFILGIFGYNFFRQLAQKRRGSLP
ncbi:hypothetical protein Sden_2995 [Shewanella denitrificans OS217]|uniref:Uncharacterized protein n=1 Tax=Shewanella denitrificans (strain OS217 / ATCC BAA-1090 / DSM 15013) TaxID=318161 RepID=Q12JV3_SHEDO|nr:hypothetical protein [Shewanella denitrificans]ABE56273.1 hypothetical protein Sden_2995 [Shewanella denitrificans OS217]